MGWAEFVGNPRLVEVLRRLLAAERLPHALLFAGQQGVGKFTLATYFARAALCPVARNDFCGQCVSCRTLLALENLPALMAAARQARGSANPEEVPLVLQPHADVCVIVPDPTYIRVSQMRYVRRLAYTEPAAGRRRVVIFDDAERLRPDYASTLLKVLEEPPEHTHFILVAHAPYELPDTIRSRCVPLHFAPLPSACLEAYLAQHRPKLPPKDRQLLAAVAAGSLGTALSLDLERYRQGRLHALSLLQAAVSGSAFDPAALFSATGALAGRGQQLTKGSEPGEARLEFEFSLQILYNLISDVTYLKARASEVGLRNPDLHNRLERLSREVSWQWLTVAVGELDSIQRGLRRNINRQLALDALALASALQRTTEETSEPVAASE